MIGRTVIVGFGYKARRGKDTAVNAILEAYPHGTRRYAFGDALKVEVSCAQLDRYQQDNLPMADWTPSRGMEHLCAWAGVRYDLDAEKQRALLQWWGTEYRRAADPDYWVKRLSEKILQEQPEFALIPDVRFFNEYTLCDYAVRMDRPGFEIADGQHHISEHQLDSLPDAAWSSIISAVTPHEVERKAVGFFLEGVCGDFPVKCRS